MAKTGLKHTNTKEYVMMDVGQIITYAKEGEQLAFTLLFDRYYIPLMNFLKRNFVTVHKELSEEVEDICMDTFNKAFMNIASYDEKYKFSTWLYRIAINCLTDFLRRSRNSISDASASDSGEVGNVLSPDTPEENLIISQQIEKTMKAIDRLPDIYKDVMLLYIEGYALDDIADELDISLSNTKVRVKRGKDLLAEALKDSPLAQKRKKKVATRKTKE
ncbi:MAG: RNA polymerase sigma factor [Bacteroidales bacterium]|jgi:RNA polymerase sigma-70 factor (ECF subfamily)|nr:RNA polymerase sigma factor [Bacteroidales bacterium]MBR0315122.1 RNA polymerase sigma factor [Bacteroidales bacterium]MBR6971248.1 RNA polymerase sigma factor [Bacteroidales bacterium]